MKGWRIYFRYDVRFGGEQKPMEIDEFGLVEVLNEIPVGGYRGLESITKIEHLEE